MSRLKRACPGPDSLILAVTLSRIPLAVLFAVLLPSKDGMALGDERTLIACGMVLGLLEASDLLDGLLARFLGRASDWGAILDPYADSVSRLIVFWALARAELALWATPLVMALRDITVAYSRLVLMRKGFSVSARFSGKVKAVVQGGAALLLVLGPLFWTVTWPATALSWLVILVTGLSAFEYVVAAVQRSARKASE